MHMIGQLKDEVRLLVQDYLSDPLSGRGIKALREQGRLHEAACAWAALALRGQRVLLTGQQAKLDLAADHAEGKWVNVGLTLAPAGEASWAFAGRFTMCPKASPGCMRTCVGNRGQGRAKKDGGAMDHGYVARCGRTIALAFDRPRFKQLLESEVRRAAYDAAYDGAKLAVRPDVASDEQRLAAFLASLRGKFDNITVPVATIYGYTADPECLEWDDGVHRILSRKENNDADVMAALASGHSVAVVFDAKKGALPTRWRGYPVIDGDVHDLWFLRLDGPTVVGLSLKGRRLEKAMARAKGFAVAPETNNNPTAEAVA
tara:strand:- start:473 stop:1423 length:951 start_codon:yes stop_codon:yes gene_type:complete